LTNISARQDPIGVALDGYVIYGMYEGASGAKPTRDACNGHTGSVPANSTYGTTSSECRDLYPACSTTAYDFDLYTTSGVEFNYKLWCTCYQHMGSTTGANSYSNSAGISTSQASPGDATTPTTTPTSSTCTAAADATKTVHANTADANTADAKNSRRVPPGFQRDRQLRAGAARRRSRLRARVSTHDGCRTGPPRGKDGPASGEDVSWDGPASGQEAQH